MVETKVPKDIRSYKSKIIGPFTMRQVICLSIAAVIDIVLYQILSNTAHVSTNVYLYTFIFIDTFILSFTIEISGMPMEKYLKIIIVDNYLTPAKRFEKTDIYDPGSTKGPSADEKKAAEKRMKAIISEHPELTPYK